MMCPQMFDSCQGEVKLPLAITIAPEACCKAKRLVVGCLQTYNLSYRILAQQFCTRTYACPYIHNFNPSISLEASCGELMILLGSENKNKSQMTTV
jgi:hypothetical protein